MADSVAQLTASSDDLDANDVGIIAGFVEEIAVEATQNEEVRKLSHSAIPQTVLSATFML